MKAKDGHGNEGWMKETKQGRGWVSGSDCREQEREGSGVMVLRRGHVPRTPGGKKMLVT